MATAKLQETFLGVERQGVSDLLTSLQVDNMARRHPSFTDKPLIAT